MAIGWVGGCGTGSKEASLDMPVPHIGRGKGYRLLPAGAAVEHARPVDGLRCGRRGKRRFAAHLEVFANRLDVVIPAGVGIAPPRVRDGAYVTGGRCFYPARTIEPTGLIELDEGAKVTLGQFFDLWGQPLGPKRVLGFRAAPGEPVSAFVDGQRSSGDPSAIQLRRHAAIVVEVGGYFPPTPRYVFPPGL